MGCQWILCSKPIFIHSIILNAIFFNKISPFDQTQTDTYICMREERFAQHKLNCMPHAYTNTHFSNFISINCARLFFNLRLHLIYCVSVCGCHISLHIFISCSIAISISCEFIRKNKKTKIFSTRHTSQNSTFCAWMNVHDEEAHLNNNKFSNHALHSQLNVFMDCFIQFNSFISR